MKFTVESSPHIKSNDTVQKLMGRVIIALLPAVIYSIILYGFHTLVLYIFGIAGAVLAELLCKKLRKMPHHIEDLSAVVTGILMVMVLPPTITTSIAFIGSAIGIIFAKEVFGGLGFNVFNPALVGRAFLQVAFPKEMSLYEPIKNIPFNISSSLSPYSISDSVTTATGTIFNYADALTQTTPLGFMKFINDEFIPNTFTEQLLFESKYYLQMIIGNTSGSIGESSFLLLLLGGIFLALTNTLNWRIPIGMTIPVISISLISSFVLPGTYPTFIYHILGGGFALGAIYMATDMATAPNGNLGSWVYAFIIGITLILLRIFGTSPEYVMYAILIGNMFVPLINMCIKPDTFGKKEARKMDKMEVVK